MRAELYSCSRDRCVYSSPTVLLLRFHHQVHVPQIQSYRTCRRIFKRASAMEKAKPEGKIRNHDGPAGGRNTGVADANGRAAQLRRGGRHAMKLYEKLADDIERLIRRACTGTATGFRRCGRRASSTGSASRPCCMRICCWKAAGCSKPAAVGLFREPAARRQPCTGARAAAVEADRDLVVGRREPAGAVDAALDRHRRRGAASARRIRTRACFRSRS